AGVSAKPVPLYYGERKVFTVAGFNQGVSWYLRRLPAVWVEGEIAELKQSDSWGFVYLTLKDPEQGATLAATMTRQRFGQADPPAARYPPARFEVVETVVQGPGAPARIAAALRTLDAAPEVDVIVLARGGGSVEDLLPFSDEAVCRAVAACATPVVSAIGHEQ